MTPDWLAQLAPAHAPPPPGWWPLAPGWWGLGVLLVLAAFALWRWYSRPHARLRRAALRELVQLERTNPTDADLAQGLQRLVRRYALARYGHATVAGLSGQRWVDFVAEHGATQWQDQPGADLLRAAYGASATQQPQRALWLAGARAFFRGKP
jgi:hypothetical protein